MVRRLRVLGSGVLTSVLLSAPAAAQGTGPFTAPDVRISRAADGESLAAPGGDAAGQVAAFLRATGHGEATASSLVLASRSVAPRTGASHLRFTQRVGGLDVYGTYVKATQDANGSLVSVIENLAVARAVGAPAQPIDESRALAIGWQAVHGGAPAAPGLVRRDGNTSVFARTPFFHREPTVTRVAVPVGNALRAGYLVETWTARGNHLHHTLVGGDGAVLGVEARTASDSYHVFRIDPSRTAQATVSGTTANATASPSGWLFSGVQKTTNIAGNNVNAYLDVDANNAADAGGLDVTTGDFLTAFVATEQPGSAANKAVATQNLFYLNNLTHDILYTHGFDEAAGNFQENNFGRGGLASDGVYAEVQDGSGTDNANFSTPADGSNPRMQMYVWSAPNDAQVVIGAAVYTGQNASFSAKPTTAGTAGTLVVANDGVGTTSDACDKFPRNALVGKVVIADRGTCNFDLKVSNAARAGAIAVIVANNDASAIFAMGGTTTSKIPAVMVSQADGVLIKAAAGQQGRVRAADPAPINRDSAVDSDIVFHEYGHGLTWRMIGSMSGAMSGAIGEGMSDVLALLFNNSYTEYTAADDDVVGEYAAFSAAGIRSEPYDTYSRSYADLTWTGVHYDGELYAAIGFRMRRNFLQNGLTTPALLDYLVDGMNFTPAGPKYENMRDGILSSIAADTTVTATERTRRQCLVWDAFADFGVGSGAKATAKRTGGYTVSESFALPTGCTAVD